MTDDIIIIGGGPVGLYLGLLLHQHDIPFQLYEASLTPHTHSRSIGIHPPTLEFFEELELTSTFLAQGLPIRKGHAFHNQERITTVDFDSCPPPYTFVLALPQFQTETILREALTKRASEQVHWGWKAQQAKRTPEGARLQFVHIESGKAQTVNAKTVIACDGTHSQIRSEANFAWNGQRYPDTYIMGDTRDTTDFGEDAAIYLHEDGLIESFPLTGGNRRWVAKTDEYLTHPDYQSLRTLVARRTGFRLPDQQPEMLSSFGVQHFTAAPMADATFWLAGDAAHVVSPIGGQGMNLGWMGAHTLGQQLLEVKAGRQSMSEAANRYSNIQTHRAKRAGKRAEMNMRLGRSQQHPGLFRMMLKWGLSEPLHPLLTRLFTMRNLDNGWI